MRGVRFKVRRRLRPFCISNATSLESRLTQLIPGGRKEEPLSVNLQMKPFSIVRPPFVTRPQMTAFHKHKRRVAASAFVNNLISTLLTATPTPPPTVAHVLPGALKVSLGTICLGICSKCRSSHPPSPSL